MADRSELARVQQKYRALLNARLALRQQFERIDYRFDVVQPKLDELADQATQGTLPEVGLDDE